MGGKHEEFPIWLVWCLSRGGLVILRSICFDNALANHHRKSIEVSEIETDGNTIRVWVERSTANHLFAGIVQFPKGF